MPAPPSSSGAAAELSTNHGTQRDACHRWSEMSYLTLKFCDEGLERRFASQHHAFWGKCDCFSAAAVLLVTIRMLLKADGEKVWQQYVWLCLMVINSLSFVAFALKVTSGHRRNVVRGIWAARMVMHVSVPILRLSTSCNELRAGSLVDVFAASWMNVVIYRLLFHEYLASVVAFTCLRIFAINSQHGICRSLVAQMDQDGCSQLFATLQKGFLFIDSYSSLYLGDSFASATGHTRFKECAGFLTAASIALPTVVVVVLYCVELTGRIDFLRSNRLSSPSKSMSIAFCGKLLLFLWLNSATAWHSTMHIVDLFS